MLPPPPPSKKKEKLMETHCVEALPAQGIQVEATVLQAVSGLEGLGLGRAGILPCQYRDSTTTRLNHLVNYLKPPSLKLRSCNRGRTVAPGVPQVLEVGSPNPRVPP